MFYPEFQLLTAEGQATYQLYTCVCVCVCVCVSYLCLFVTPWTVAHQAPLSMEFSRQEYWGGLPFPSPGHLPYPGIEPRSSELQADSLLSEPPGKPTHYIFVVKCLKPFIFQVEKLRSEEERFAKSRGCPSVFQKILVLPDDSRIQQREGSWEGVLCFKGVCEILV